MSTSSRMDGTLGRRGLFGLAAAAGLLAARPARAETSLLNVSYDPTRELYAEYDKLFAATWQAAHGEAVSVRSSHGGSGAQARAVIDGLEADVVTLGLEPDIDAIVEKAGLISPDWRQRLPNGGVPYTSTIAFVVRKGNPKGIHDWADLLKPDVSIITPNPKTSAGARWNYLAAWGYALRASGGDTEKAKDFLRQILRRVPVFDTGARGATISFVQRRLGDVLLSWEDDAILSVREFGRDRLELVYPSVSIKAEPVAAVVDKVVDRRGTRAIAEAYLHGLYAPDGQEVIARHYYRPLDPAVAARHAATFPALDLFTVQDVAGGWKAAQRDHFADGGIFDQITRPTP